MIYMLAYFQPKRQSNYTYGTDLRVDWGLVLNSGINVRRYKIQEGGTHRDIETSLRNKARNGHEGCQIEGWNLYVTTQLTYCAKRHALDKFARNHGKDITGPVALEHENGFPRS